MKKNRGLRWLFVIILVGIPWIYLATIWNSLPERIPVHFGLSGNPDRYGTKSEILISPIVVSALSILIYLLLTNIYKIDPKRWASRQPQTFFKIAMAVVVFMCCINLFVLNWTVRQHTVGLNLILAVTGLLLAYIGNMMHSIKPNYFAGFRLPWTLESENNWKATHLLVSKLWFGGGLLIAVLALLIPLSAMIFAMPPIIIVMVVIPVIYSYNYFKKEKTTHS